MKQLLIMCFAALLTACDKPACNNKNQVFEKYAPSSVEYKRELTKQIRIIGSNRMRYWIDGYSAEGRKEYMHISIQGDGLCAKTMLDITIANGITHYKEAKGNGYNGAELRGLLYRIDSTDGNYNFIFESVNWIAD
jgi:hypothetical protein